jgi:hypothetical protein
MSEAASGEEAFLQRDMDRQIAQRCRRRSQPNLGASDRIFPLGVCRFQRRPFNQATAARIIVTKKTFCISKRAVL